jgi:ribosomal protein S18 acetylase RimI-like enzyme
MEESMIRNYRPDDIQDIKRIADKAWANIFAMFKERYGEELFETLYPNSATLKGSQIEEHCKAHPDWVYVCEESGRVVGFATFNLNRAQGIGELSNNAVDPDCGLKGIGQQLYKAIFERLKAEGMKHACVQTGLDEAHAPARRAYERAGFDIHHERVFYYKKL